MGYYTNYSLKIDKKKLHEYEEDRINKIKNQIKETKDPDIKRVLEEGVYKLEKESHYYPEEKVAKHVGYNPFEGECKWYDHEKDMHEFSKKYPETLFILKGVSEDNEQWIKYFLNGKLQFAPAKITFDEFDESKLV